MGWGGALISYINHEGTLENIISEVDKSTNFIKSGRADEDLSRYYPNSLPITRQPQLAGELPRKHMRVKHIWIKNNSNLQ